MNLLQDIITYVRRLIKSPSNTIVTDALIVDYINRFCISDMPARVQLFDYKTKYQFQTIPGIDQYNMPLYNVQTTDSTLGSITINSYPMYQGFTGNVRVNGINTPFYTQRTDFFNTWPNYTQTLVQAGTGNGTVGPYTLTVPFFPALPGHIDISGIIELNKYRGTNQDPPFITSTEINATNPQFVQSVPVTSVFPGVYFTSTADNGNNIVVSDSGMFLQDGTNGDLYGLLIAPGKGPNGNLPLSGAVPNYSVTTNTINYSSGVATNVYFPQAIPSGTPINAQCYFIQPGIPRALLYYDNIITLRNPPNTQYLIEIDAYLTPAAYLNSSSAVPFGYASEYIARGAARKMLSDTGDVEQFMFYEPLFREQENLVWKRSQRQFTSTRVQTIYSSPGAPASFNQSSFGV